MCSDAKMCPHCDEYSIDIPRFCERMTDNELLDFHVEMQADTNLVAAEVARRGLRLRTVICPPATDLELAFRRSPQQGQSS